MVIGGFTEPSGSRNGLGALLLAFYEGDDFIYSGKVGTGFSDEILKEQPSEVAPAYVFLA